MNTSLYGEFIVSLPVERLTYLMYILIMAKQLYEKQQEQYKEIYPLVHAKDIMTDEGKNLIDVIKTFNHLYVNFINTKQETRNSIPVDIRRYGLWITYKYNDELITEWFKASNIDAKDNTKWEADEYWEAVPDMKYIYDNASKIPNGAILPEMLSPAILQLLSNGNTIYNVVDDEDLESNECNVIKFKDRVYNKEFASGKGYKILRKNWVNGKNVLTQDMINNTNTIYEIRYDFDLDEKRIVIPNGSLLKFNGGSLNNGNIYNDNSLVEIDRNFTDVFINIIFENGINYVIKDTDGYVYSDKVGFNTTITDDLSYAEYNFELFSLLVTYYSKIVLTRIYDIKPTKVINLNHSLYIKGGGLNIIGSSTSLFNIKNGASIHFDSTTFYANVDNYRLFYCTNLNFFIQEIYVENCNFNCSLGGLYFTDDVNNGITNVIIRNNKIRYSYKDVYFFTVCDAKFINPVYIENNSVINFSQCFIYFATTNEYTNSNKKALDSAPVYFLNNYCVGATTKYNNNIGNSSYHCAALVETNTFICRNNVIKNIITTYENGTAYDCYASCQHYIFENNIVENIVKFDITGAEHDDMYYQACELAKSKGMIDQTKYATRIFKNNRYTLDIDFIKTIGATQTELFIWMFDYTFTNTNVDIIFDNNIIDYPINIRGVSTSRYFKRFEFINNNIHAKSWKYGIFACNNVTPVEYYEISNNKIKQDNPVIYIPFIFAGNTDIKNKNLTIKNNILDSVISFYNGNCSTFENIICKDNICHVQEYELTKNIPIEDNANHDNIDIEFNLDIANTTNDSTYYYYSIFNHGKLQYNINKVINKKAYFSFKINTTKYSIFTVEYDFNNKHYMFDILVDGANSKIYNLYSGNSFSYNTTGILIQSILSLLSIRFVYNNYPCMYIQLLDNVENLIIKEVVSDNMNITRDILIKSGTSPSRPEEVVKLSDIYIGHIYIQTGDGPRWWNGTNWITYDNTID